jgi:hypothetical protein
VECVVKSLLLKNYFFRMVKTFVEDANMGFFVIAAITQYA